jgi:hypothetical protein
MTLRLPVFLIALIAVTGTVDAASKSASPGSAPAAKNAPPDARSLFNQFAISNAAASKCGKPSKETVTQFRSNFQLVAAATSQELHKLHPEMTPAQISEAMNNQSAMLSQKVFAVIKEKGCDDPGVVQLVRSYDAEAMWDPRKNAAGDKTKKK